MPEETEAQSAALRGPVNDPGDISQDEVPLGKPKQAEVGILS